MVEKFSPGQGIYKKVEEFTKRTNDNDTEVPLWPLGSECKKVIAWPTFHIFWNKNYPSIKICKKGADTCTDCHTLLNEFRSEHTHA